jgi:hypothetical protein
VLWKVLDLCLPILAATGVLDGQVIPRQNGQGSAQRTEFGNWSARTRSGLTLMGTWTAVYDTARRTVTGSWTLSGGQGIPVANGAWSASKAPTQWNGNWRAVVTGRAGEYSGTWTSSVDLKVDGTFLDLFERAVQDVVRGTWHAGIQSGSWAIRAAKKEGGP